MFKLKKSSGINFSSSHLTKCQQLKGCPQPQVTEGPSTPQALQSVCEFKEHFTSCNQLTPLRTPAKVSCALGLTRQQTPAAFARLQASCGGNRWDLARLYQPSRCQLKSEPSCPLSADQVSSWKHSQEADFHFKLFVVAGSALLFWHTTSAVKHRSHLGRALASHSS